MNKINIPGFTAEASLNSPQLYSGILSPMQVTDKLRPALFRVEVTDEDQCFIDCVNEGRAHNDCFEECYLSIH